MPDDILISELSNAPQIDDSAVFPLTQDNGGSPATFKATMSQIAGKIGEGTTFANLHTTSKTLVGAINEVAQSGGSAELIGTASGSIATFADGGNGIPLKSCEVEIVAQQAGSGTPSPSNVRAISGFSSVNVNVCGKNLFDSSTLVQGGISSAGLDNVSDVRVRSGYFYLPEGDYIIKSDVYIDTVNFYKSADSSTFISRVIGSSTQVSFTLAFGCYVRVAFRKSNTSSEITPSEVTNAQLEIGEQPTAYTPHTGTTHTIALPETIYGGYGDVCKANGITKTFEHGSIDGTEADSAYGIASSQPVAFYRLPNNCVNFQGLCNKAVNAGSKSFAQYTDGDFTFYGNAFYFYYNGTKTVLDLKSYIANTIGGYDFIYELATPTTLTTSALSIPTLSGTNNIYANCGDVDVEYFNENADEIAELVNVYPYEVSGVLTAGQTSVTLSSGLIKADSTIDVYTSDGTNYNSVSVSSGSVTIAFDEQQADLGVKVRVS